MPLVQLDLAEIAELGTQVALHGAMRAGEMLVDDMFDVIVAIAVVIYEMAPQSS